MSVFVGVGFRAVVSMLVVFVMGVAMAVAQHFVGVVVGVALADMEPDTHGHQDASWPEQQAWRFAQQGKRQRGTSERRNGKIRAGPGRAQLA
jgi:hypothetical protein